MLVSVWLFSIMLAPELASVAKCIQVESFQYAIYLSAPLYILAACLHMYFQLRSPCCCQGASLDYMPVDPKFPEKLEEGERSSRILKPTFASNGIWAVAIRMLCDLWTVILPFILLVLEAAERPMSSIAIGGSYRAAKATKTTLSVMPYGFLWQQAWQSIAASPFIIAGWVVLGVPAVGVLIMGVMLLARACGSEVGGEEAVELTPPGNNDMSESLH